MQPYDSNYKMKPPLRRAAMATRSRTAWSGDDRRNRHRSCAAPGSEKMQEFERCPFGIIGLETAIPLALEQLVARAS